MKHSKKILKTLGAQIINEGEYLAAENLEEAQPLAAAVGVAKLSTIPFCAIVSLFMSWLLEGPHHAKKRKEERQSKCDSVSLTRTVGRNLQQ